MHTETIDDAIPVANLQENLIDEIFKAAGLSEQGSLRRFGGRLFSKPAQRFSAIAFRFDQIAGSNGLPDAAADTILQFGLSVQARGTETIPSKGPLIIAGNHPGSLDGLCVLANLPRDDVRFVISGVPLTHSLPNTQLYLIYAPGDKHERMLAIRTMVRHLRDGGAVLIFPSGRLDPDPDVLPGAEQALELWSPSLEILLRKVPHAQVVIAITSGVLAVNILNNPITRLQTGWRRQKLAEFIQVARMLSKPGAYPLLPRVTFSRPVELPPHQAGEEDSDTLRQLINLAKSTLQEHGSWQSVE